MWIKFTDDLINLAECSKVIVRHDEREGIWYSVAIFDDLQGHREEIIYTTTEYVVIQEYQRKLWYKLKKSKKENE